MLHSITLSFNGGEVTPYIAYLNNFDKHASSCARMENFLPMPYGGIKKRPGTIHLAALPAASRLETFIFSDASAVVMAFHPEGIVIFSPDGTEIDTISKTIPDPFNLQFSQVNDIIDVVSPDFAPCQIISADGITWTLSDITFKYPPLLDENDDDSHTLSVPFVTGSSQAVGASFTLTSSTAFFTADHVGAYFQISRKRVAEAFEKSLSAVNATQSVTMEMSGIAYFSTASTTGGWDGTFSVQKSTDGGATWETLREFSAEGDRNVPVTEIDFGPEFSWGRIAYAGTTATASRGILAAAEPYIRGVVKVTAFLTSTTVTVEAITRVPCTATKFWAEGAFSKFQGFPRAIAIHDRRRVYAGTSRRPMSLWLSALDDLQNFETGTEADEGFYRTFASTRQSPILWLASQRRLFVGTEAGEWVVGADTESLISPTSFSAREYTRFGSNTVPGITVNDSIYFIERAGLRLRELAYVLERETFDAQNLTRLAEHLPVSGITQIAFQHSREPMLWCTTASGTLLAFAYDRSESIAAWSRHTTAAGGQFYSVAVLRTDADDDDVFLAVRRIPDGGDEEDAQYHLEKLAPSQQLYQENENLDDAHFVDSGIIAATVLDSDVYHVTVPPHLEGALLYVLANGIFYERYVLAGEFTLPEECTKVHAGLPITSTLDTLPLDITVDNGSSHSRRKRAQELKLAVYKSFGGSYTYDGQTAIINYTNTGDIMDAAPALVTTWIPQTLPPAHLDDLTLSIVHTEPYPFLCRAAIISWTLHEP